jgi:hypothetical protein
MISYLLFNFVFFLFSNNPYSLSSTSCELTWTCENSKFKFRDNFGIKQRAPGSKCRIGGSMCRPVLQCVLEVPAGTSNLNQSTGRYFEFLKNVFNFFFCIYPFVQSCSTFYDKHQI